MSDLQVPPPVQVPERDAIERKFLFKDFSEAFSFMTKTALLAEKVGRARVGRCVGSVCIHGYNNRRVS